MINTMSPFELICLWLADEKNAGAPKPCQGVLSTVSKNAIPHSRVVAISEITEHGLLFFTQKGTRKVTELENNPNATITFWFELLQREIIIEGIAEPLSDAENQLYWKNYPKEAQVRFYSYAPTSSQPINSKDVLENKKRAIERDYQDKELPISPYYCGYRLKPIRMVFYAYLIDQLSDVIEYQNINNEWVKQLLSP